MQYHNVTISKVDIVSKDIYFILPCPGRKEVNPQARNVFGIWTNQAILIGLNKSHLWVWYFTLNNTCMQGATPNKC